MATTFEFKQGDLYPYLEGTLRDRLGPVDLTGATVTLTLRTQGVSPTIRGGACVVDADPTTGKFSYIWQTVDSASATTYDAEVKVVWGNGKPTRFPNKGFNTVLINPNAEA